MDSTWLRDLCQLVGEAYVITSPTEHERYVSDWFGRMAGSARAVVRPGTTAEVAAVVACCRRHGIPIVPQGGNTGLVGGALPDDSGTQLVLSLERMNRIRAMDPLGKTVTVEAGVLLVHVQDAARQQGLEFPLSMGSEGSCTVGGMLSTNAGGTAVLRYGNARALCLGLEVVTAEGDVVPGLRQLRKDNTGYDLRDLFIGAEGTLGIITAAVLSMVPAPKAKLSALVALESAEHAVALLERVQSQVGPLLSAFELISHACLNLVALHFPQLPYPFASPTPYAVLLELSDHESEEHTLALMEQVLGEALARGMATDVLLPQSLAQSDKFWDIREHIPLSQVKDGKNVKHDISLPIAAVPAFLTQAAHLITSLHADARVIAFGHLGDGNIHFNVAAPISQPPDDILQDKVRISNAIHELVDALNGSISAEHGIGQMKAHDLARFKNPVEMRLFHQIKQALDPEGIFNPGKILSAHNPSKAENP
jgi:FAD/FMN-containing dehydrogenase